MNVSKVKIYLQQRLFVFASGVIGCLQATEALKILGEFAEPLVGKLCTYDAQDGSFYAVRLRPR